jgi:hypothetical protein
VCYRPGEAQAVDALPSAIAADYDRRFKKPRRGLCHDGVRWGAGPAAVERFLIEVVDRYSGRPLQSRGGAGGVSVIHRAGYRRG